MQSAASHTDYLDDYLDGELKAAESVEEFDLVIKGNPINLLFEVKIDSTCRSKGYVAIKSKRGSFMKRMEYDQNCRKTITVHDETVLFRDKTARHRSNCL
jgi:hypothetical protein